VMATRVDAVVEEGVRLLAAGPGLPKSISICDVGLRDGLQSLDAFIPTEVKLKIVDELIRSGIHRIQATSFVRFDKIPQLRDADEFFARLPKREDVEFSALVMNEKGLSRAIDACVKFVDVVVSVSDSHSQSNSGMTSVDALKRARSVVGMAREYGVEASLGLATALGCPFEGFGPVLRVDEIVSEAVEEWGVRHVSLADTAGMASPALVAGVVGPLIRRFGEVDFSIHLHDTRRMGLANVLAGMMVGAKSFDASIGGLGGCPFAPGASGNIATEDIVNLAEGMGITTGVSMNALLAVVDLIRGVVGPVDSGVGKAGPSVGGVS
jgi:hydroxymethylglutaryl-CoA lyase